MKKPAKTTFIRIYPGFAPEVYTVKDPDTDEFYIVDTELVESLGADVQRTRLYSWTDTRGAVGVWPARLPKAVGPKDAWAESAVEAAEVAETEWVRLVPDLDAGRYEVLPAKTQYAEPSWPDTPIDELVEQAFGDTYIDTEDHPIVRKLRGEEMPSQKGGGR